MARALGPSVRDVFTFGYETFPNARRDWVAVAVTMSRLFEFNGLSVVQWCDQEFGHANWYYHDTTFYFDSEEDAVLFKMRFG